jgi:tetratricopeptide (TPR) repeat protein
LATAILPLTLDVEGARLDSRASAMEMLEIGEPREAIQKLEEAVACAPHYSDGYVGLGIAYAMTSQVYPALDSFERAAELDPTNFYAHFKLAQFHFKLRIPDKGYEEAGRALKCATTPEEKWLVAQILKEERGREAGGVRRPAWSRPYSRFWLRVGGALLLMGCLALILSLR